MGERGRFPQTDHARRGHNFYFLRHRVTICDVQKEKKKFLFIFPEEN